MRRLPIPELVIGLVVFAGFVAVALLDYGHQKSQAATYDSFSSFDYQRGGYRAWFEMLHTEGVPVARFEQHPVYLDDSIATLIVANNAFDALVRERLGEQAGTYGPADIAALERWVKSGGRLVWLVDAATERTLPDSSLVRQLLGVQDASALRLPAVITSSAKKDAALAIAASPLTDGVHAVLGTSRLRIPFGTDPAVAPLVADRAGTVVGSYPLGKGTVIVVTDESLFENGRLTNADNARLAYNVAASGLQPGQAIAFEEWSHGYQSGDTWWAILPSPMRLGVWIGAAALLLALFGATWRFGPALVPPANDERTSSEYLTSVATLLERAGAARIAVKDLAQVGMRAAARSVGLPDDAKATAIAKRLEGTETGDRRAADLVSLERLAGFEHPTKEELVRAARLSLDIRKDLGDGLQHLAPRRSASRRTA